MKTKNSFFKRTLVVAVCVSVAGFMAGGCNKDDNNAVNNQPYTVTGDAAGSQVVPMVNGTGTGNFSGTYDPATGMLIYTTGWTGLSGAPTSAGFYEGATGTTGTAVGSPWVMPYGATGTGSISDTMMLTGEQAASLTTGNWYYSYGTTAYPGGEVRGQMTATR